MDPGEGSRDRTWGGEPGELTDISSVCADARGTVYVFQRKPARIRVYGPDGAWLRDIGAEGDGPGEYRSGMFGIHGDIIFVQDPNNTRLTTFRTSGEFIASHRSQCCWWTSSFPVFADGTIGIMGPPPANATDRQGALYLTRLDGTVADTILMPVRSTNDDNGWTVRRTSGNNTSCGEGIRSTVGAHAYLPDRSGLGNTGQPLAITDARRHVRLSGMAPTITITASRRFLISGDRRDSGRLADAFVHRRRATSVDMAAWASHGDACRASGSAAGARGTVSGLDVFTMKAVAGEVRAPMASSCAACGSATSCTSGARATTGCRR